MKRVLLGISCLWGISVFPQVSAKIETLFQFNDENSTKKEYLFKAPMKTLIDSEEDFYMIMQNGVIRKFRLSIN